MRGALRKPTSVTGDGIAAARRITFVDRQESPRGLIHRRGCQSFEMLETLQRRTFCNHFSTKNSLPRTVENSFFESLAAFFERELIVAKQELAIIRMLETLQGRPSCNHSSTRNFLLSTVGSSFSNHCQLFFESLFEKKERTC